MEPKLDIQMEPRVETLLNAIREQTARIFQDNLVGLYLHGSMPFGCFRWAVSDIDLLVVTKTAPDLPEKEAYIQALLKLSESAPPKGLEISLVTEDACRHFVYPTPYELHFSPMHIQWAKDDLHAYCLGMRGVDPDLAAHFTVTRAVGRTLLGKPIAEVFGEVPRAAYLDSIRIDVEGAAEDILENPVYYTLSLCRVLAYIQDSLVVSKAGGGEWGERTLPAPYNALVAEAAEAYRADSPEDTPVDALFPMDEAHTERLKAFAAYMLARIFPKEAE